MIRRVYNFYLIGKKMLKIISLLLFTLNTCSGVIYHLNESEYAGIPPIFYLDPYKECIQEGGEYCSLRMKLVSDQPSNLLKTIEEYSAHKSHFNHKVLNHGICITKTCTKIMQANITQDLRATLESCLNNTMWKDYRLHAKLTENPTCHKAGENNEKIGVLDVIIAVLLGIILVFNIVGSLREFIISGRDNSFLSCFSLSRNWRTLTGPYGVTDPRREGMKAFNGIRSIMSMTVICSHSFIQFFISSGNTRDLEEGYKYMKYIGTGSIIIQTFFAMSGFLLAYNTAVVEGERGESCLKVLNRILLRWLRLAPPYLVVLALMMTWLRFVGAGPLWQTAVGAHIESCYRYWWFMPLHVINYVDHEQCFVEYWYIAAELQLSILGLLVLGLLRGRARWWTLASLLVAGMIAPAAHTWVQDLDGWALLTPETSRNFFVEDPTFNNVYKRGHTNVAAYVIGAAVGLLVCGWQKDHVEKKHRDTLRHCRFVYWATVPAMFAIVLTGSVFMDRPTPLLLRVGYSLLGRVVFGGCVAVLLAGLTLKIDALYRDILAWRGWTRVARLSYCAYVVHVTLLRLYSSAQDELARVSFTSTLCLLLGAVLTSFLVATPLWLLVEAPAAALDKHLTRSDTSEQPPVHSCEEIHSTNPSDTDSIKHVVEKL